MPEIPSQLGDLAQAASDGLSALPWGAHMVMAIVMGAGLVMWLTGRRLLRPVYALVFAAGGAVFGFFGPSSLGIQADPYIGLIAGLIAGLLIGALAFRVSMALSLAAVGAVAMPLLFAGVLAVAQEPDIAESLGVTDPDKLIAQYEAESKADATSENATDDSTFDDFLKSENMTSEEFKNAAIAASLRIRAFALAMWDDAQARLDNMPPRHQLLLLIAGVVGAALGFSLGFGFPGRVAAISTAFVGAAVWLPAAAWLLNAMGADIGRVIPGASVTWLALWVAVSVIGVLLQWTALKPRADESRD